MHVAAPVASPIEADAALAGRTCPRRAPPRPAARAARTEARERRFRSGRANARVLLVDDDRDIREVVGAMLEAVGPHRGAGDERRGGARARARARRSTSLVLDWNLPGMTGIELCRVVRRDADARRRCPCSSSRRTPSSRDVVEAFASGADDYVVKPFRAPELGARIFGLLRRARMGQPAT